MSGHDAFPVLHVHLSPGQRHFSRCFSPYPANRSELRPRLAGWVRTRLDEEEEKRSRECHKQTKPRHSDWQHVIHQRSQQDDL